MGSTRLALAGGAIIYVVNELFGAGRKLGAPGWGITAGILLGFITEFILKPWADSSGSPRAERRIG